MPIKLVATMTKVFETPDEAVAFARDEMQITDEQLADLEKDRRVTGEDPKSGESYILDWNEVK